MSQIYGIINKNIDEIHSEIGRIIYESESFNMIYVSIGGKLNEYTVRFRENTQKEYPTNAIEQMYPTFLQNRNQKNKILIIAIDNFRDRFIFENNKQIIGKKIANNVTFIMINYQFDKTSLISFTKFITRIAKNNEINKNMFIICNFVKHLNEPNIRELRDEEMIPKTIQLVLNESSEYSDCFYEWFGYRFYLYNFIYRYKPYEFGLHLGRLIPDIVFLIENQTKDNMKSVSVVQNSELIKFLDNIYDITNRVDNDDDTNIAVSLKKYLSINKQLVTSMSERKSSTDQYTKLSYPLSF